MVYAATGQPYPYKDAYRVAAEPGMGAEPIGFGAVPKSTEPPKRYSKVKIPKVTTVDFETFGIEGRPDYPPVPVGVSIKKFGKKPTYFSWGHVNGRNLHTKEAATVALREAFSNPDGVCFHNAKFDLDVALTHLGLEIPPWSKVHETMFLLFLDNPHQRDLQLKPAAKRLLGMEPEERDAVTDWLLANQPVPGVKIGKSAQSKEPPGKYIAYAPPEVVGPYANGDTIRTEALFVHLFQKTYDREMGAAYDRERTLIPILMGMERNGIRVDLPRLRKDVAEYNEIILMCERWVRFKLGVDLAVGEEEFNLDSGQQLVSALVKAGFADVAKMGVTKTGKVKADKAALANGVNDPQLAATLQYLTQLKTCVRTFMEPWLKTAEKSGGLIFTTWHQTRGNDGGARTGRFSSSPNFQNMPKEFAMLWYHEAVEYNKTREIKDRVNLKKYPKCPWKTLRKLPLCRSYIIPYKPGHVLVGRDYSQQEPRILAHFEDGELQAQYIANPWIDYHDNAKAHLERIFGRPFARKPVKNINLGIIYGQGVPSLAAKNGESVEDTKELRDAIYTLYPGLRQMYNDMRMRSKTNQPIRTWGGREYYCEPPAIIDGRLRTFDYKLVNVLVQGSAADCTKEGMIALYLTQQANAERDLAAAIRKLEKRGWYLLLQVHDELVMSVPEKDLVVAQEALRLAMESVQFDVKILSEGSYSNENWASMKDYDKKGKIVYQKKAA